MLCRRQIAIGCGVRPSAITIDRRQGPEAEAYPLTKNDRNEQYLRQNISSHLFRSNALCGNNSLLLQIPNMVEMDVNMLGTLGSLIVGERHGTLVVHI